MTNHQPHWEKELASPPLNQGSLSAGLIRNIKEKAAQEEQSSRLKSRRWGIWAAAGIVLLAVAVSQKDAFMNVRPPVDQVQQPPTSAPPVVNSEWIRTTSPYQGENNISTDSDIRITFREEMDAATLNAQTVSVLDGKHGSRNIIDMFNLNYEADTRILRLSWKNPESSYGTSNGIQVEISAKVKNTRGEEMGQAYSFGFSVSDKDVKTQTVSHGMRVQGVIVKIDKEASAIKTLSLNVTKNLPYSGNAVNYDFKGQTVDISFENGTMDSDFVSQIKRDATIAITFSQVSTPEGKVIYGSEPDFIYLVELQP